MPTDNRATAERIAPFTLADAERYVLRMGTTNEQDIADAVNDDRKHRNREAASKALGYIYGQFAARPVVDKDVALAVVLHAVQSKEGYLAAEFDAGERVTEPKAAPVLTWHDDGFRKQVLADETGRIVGSVDDGNAYLSDRGHIGRYVTPQQARDAVKRLAEQRGAER